MGSHSDWTVMELCAKQLKELGVPHETKVISAHRTPDTPTVDSLRPRNRLVIGHRR